MDRKPWFKFKPDIWLNDIELRACSSAARGTMIDLMCIAHRNSDYGVCMVDDSDETRQKTAKCLSIARKTFDNHLQSLINMRRILIADDGRLFVKRMVEDFEYTLQQSDLGKQGGNPTLKAPLKPEQSKSKSKIQSKSKTPIPPGGAKAGGRLSEKQKKRTKVDVNTPDMEMIGAWFNRKPNTLWSIAEADALAEVQASPEDVVIVEKYYTASIPPEKDYRRRDLITMLNNWPGEVDRARRWESESGAMPKRTRSAI